MKFSRFKFINVRKYETVKTTTKKNKKKYRCQYRK